MASTARASKATKKTPRTDKPRERARRAEALLELAKSTLAREAFAVAQYRAALRALMTEERFRSLDEALAVERLAALPLTSVELQVEAMPF